MEVKKATYIISSPSVDLCPIADKPEVAFIGRSNVGKSSLINMLSGQSALAKVSGTPGKTQMINHFLVNGSIYWVDLPGYGFAKVSQSTRKKWEKMIEEYLRGRTSLCVIFILIDSSIGPQKIDIEFVNQIGEWGIPCAIVFTKSDKETQTIISKNIKSFLKSLSEYWESLPPHFITSNVKRHGRDSVLEFIGKICNLK
jgi:GTP-binding protein